MPDEAEALKSDEHQETSLTGDGAPNEADVLGAANPDTAGNPDPDDDTDDDSADPDETVPVELEDEPAEPHPEPRPATGGVGAIQDNVSEPGVQTTNYPNGSSSTHGEPVDDGTDVAENPDEDDNTE